VHLASQRAAFRFLSRLDGMTKTWASAETLQVAIVVTAALMQWHDVIDFQVRCDPSACLARPLVPELDAVIPLLKP
jgi:hypothetical protein